MRHRPGLSTRLRLIAWPLLAFLSLGAAAAISEQANAGARAASDVRPDHYGRGDARATLDLGTSAAAALLARARDAARPLPFALSSWLTTEPRFPTVWFASSTSQRRSWRRPVRAFCYLARSDCAGSDSDCA